VLLTPPLFHPNFWFVPDVPDETDRLCWGQSDHEAEATQP